jgi:tRNA threonylcarbamoyladenosine biosynthesis protein TsaE
MFSLEFKSSEIAEAARQFIEQMGDHRVFAFFGKMGAGKTTFIKAVCEQLGVNDVVTSPTFAIVNEYTIDQGKERMANVQRIYHFDLYRIKRTEELYDMGYEDYFYDPTALCFIEWPEMAEYLLPPETICLTIEVLPDGTRQIK